MNTISPCPPLAHRNPVSRRLDYYYVPLPLPLLSALRDTPLAIGVYATIARVFRATKAPVPLSPADLRAYDPTISESRAKRALNRLTELGYLAVVPSGGRRNAYHPTWGVIKGASRFWDLASGSLGRPPHILSERLPQDLLDHYLGRLEPHALRGAHVTRYITAPLLGLADVGAYALISAGYKASRPALEELGLVVDGQPRQLPKLEELLALASQRRLFDAGSPIALTSAGWSRLGLAPAEPAAATGSPLIFTPAPPAGQPTGQSIGQPIAQPPSDDRPASASQRPRGRAVPAAAGSHGCRSEKGSQDHPQPPSAAKPTAGGGFASPSPSRAKTEETGGTSTQAGSSPQHTPTPSEAGLRQIGVRRDVAATLAGRSLAQVERVIAQARRHQGVRDVAAWVVGALRALPADEPAPPPPPARVSDLAILTHPELSNAERLRWLTRFRNADLVDRSGILSRFLQEHPLG